MGERKEQAQRVVRERGEAEPLVEAFRTVVRGVHDQRVHGDGLSGGHDALEGIGEKQAPETAPLRRSVDRQPAGQGAGHRMAWELP